MTIFAFTFLPQLSCWSHFYRKWFLCEHLGIGHHNNKNAFTLTDKSHVLTNSTKKYLLCFEQHRKKICHRTSAEH